MNAGGFEVEFPEAAGPASRRDVHGHVNRSRVKYKPSTLPDPAAGSQTPRPDAVTVDEHLARSGDFRIGQRFDFGVFAAADEETVYCDMPPARSEQAGNTAPWRTL